MIKRFLNTEGGQDLTEYALLLAFVVVIAAAVFVVSGGNFTTIWSSANNTLDHANAAANS